MIRDVMANTAVGDDLRGLSAGIIDISFVITRTGRLRLSSMATWLTKHTHARP